MFCGTITILIFALLKEKYNESSQLIVTFMILWLGTASHLLHWHGCRRRKRHLPNTVHPPLCCDHSMSITITSKLYNEIFHERL